MVDLADHNRGERKHIMLEKAESMEQFAQMLAQSYYEDMMEASESGVPITKDPDNKELIEAIIGLFPEAGPDGWLVKTFLAYAMGACHVLVSNLKE